MEKPEIINLSGGSLRLDFGISRMKKLILLSDYSSSKRNLPVGAVAVFDRATHVANPDYLGSDIGCGMLLASLQNFSQERLKELTNNIAGKLLDCRDGLGSLGGGNHFITFYEAKDSTLPQISPKENLVLIHSGSRLEGRGFFEQRLTGDDYITGQEKVADYARDNRAALLKKVCEAAECYARPILDRKHNFLEVDSREIIYRKGAVQLMPGELSIIPSSMSGDAFLIRAKNEISEIGYSLPHSTGRKVSRSEARRRQFFLDGFPQNIYVPHFIYPENLNTEMPQCYKTLDEILPLISKYTVVEARLTPKASVML